MVCFCVAQLNSRIKEHHVCDYKYIVNEELTCTNSTVGSNSIKVLFRDDEKKKIQRNVSKEDFIPDDERMT